MEILIQPPNTVLFIILGILGVVIASMLLKKGNRKNKLLSLVITVVVVTVLLVVIYRKGSIIVDNEGIRTKTFGKIELTWDQVQEAEYLRNFESTGYGLKAKLSGIGIGDLKAGLFLLDNGDRARILVQRNTDALLLKTADRPVLLAPNELDRLVSEVSGYLDIHYNGE